MVRLSDNGIGGVRNVGTIRVTFIVYVCLILPVILTLSAYLEA